MSTTTYIKLPAADVTDEMLVQGAQLFSEHYGVWGTPPPGSSIYAGKSGSHVRMSASRLREQCMPAEADCTFVRAYVDGVLVGHVFGCHWMYQGQRVCWVTQLVVHREYRERRLATVMLTELREYNDEIFGIMSSHPAACGALAKALAGVPLGQIPLEFARDNAAAIMELSPISYVRDAKLNGKLFDASADENVISVVDSGFYVDHTEPLEALSWFREEKVWTLGELPEGHEFLLVFKMELTRRARLRPRPLKKK